MMQPGKMIFAGFVAAILVGAGGDTVAGRSVVILEVVPVSE